MWIYVYSGNDGWLEDTNGSYSVEVKKGHMLFQTTQGEVRRYGTDGNWRSMWSQQTDSENIIVKRDTGFGPDGLFVTVWTDSIARSWRIC